MTKLGSHGHHRPATFLRACIVELAPTKTQAEIVQQAGHTNQNMISLDDFHPKRFLEVDSSPRLGGENLLVDKRDDGYGDPKVLLSATADVLEPGGVTDPRSPSPRNA